MPTHVQTCICNEILYCIQECIRRIFWWFFSPGNVLTITDDSLDKKQVVLHFGWFKKKTHLVTLTSSYIKRYWRSISLQPCQSMPHSCLGWYIHIYMPLFFYSTVWPHSFGESFKEILTERPILYMITIFADHQF
jgi:hypothetical protein